MFRLVVLTLLAFQLPACTPRRVADAPVPASDPTRLDHATHAKVACTTCHRGDRRPGSTDHQPCDDERCHRKAFVSKPGPVCDVCHDHITTQPLLAAPLKPFPVENPWQSLAPTFSHARHMNASLMENRVGFHVACADCHTRGDGVHVRPDHETCARCHATEVGLANAPAMTNCQGCHRAGRRIRVRHRLIKNDLAFQHDQHRHDIKGRSIRCEDCHKGSAKANGYDDHPAPRVESCVGCHDDSDRVRYEMRMRICETCHRDKTASLTALAPRSHLPATERPLDHTLAFRRDHAEAAARSAKRCASCHVQMSGNARNACDECHQQMLPADHRITWRELDHGPESIADRTRCATCHVVEFCTACHSQRPRSHGRFGSFIDDHAQLARLNVRPCITCHDRKAFCNGCHIAAATRGRR